MPKVKTESLWQFGRRPRQYWPRNAISRFGERFPDGMTVFARNGQRFPSIAKQSFYARFSRTLILLILALFTTSASGFAESAAWAERNAWTKCRHTQQRIARGKPCPCGCTKRQKAVLRIHTENADCDAEDVLAHIPQFLQLLATLPQLWNSIANVRRSANIYRSPLAFWNLRFTLLRPG